MRYKILLAILLLATLAAPASAQEGDNPDSVYDGYWDMDGYWVPGYISLATWFTPSPRHFVGKAVYYAPGLMAAQARWRGLDLTGFEGAVSLMSPADIGQVVWLRRPGHYWEGPFLVVDAARRGDFWTIVVNRRESVEVSYRRALEWGMVVDSTYTLEGVEVWKGPRPPRWWMEPEPVEYAEWMVERATFAEGYERHPIYRAPAKWYWPDGTITGPGQPEPPELHLVDWLPYLR